jgi:hypothetical protein
VLTAQDQLLQTKWLECACCSLRFELAAALNGVDEVGFAGGGGKSVRAQVRWFYFWFINLIYLYLSVQNRKTFLQFIKKYPLQ